MSAAPGWYADPTDAASVRYWDGGSWTTHTRPAPRELVGAGVGAHAAERTTSPEAARPVVPTPVAPAPPAPEAPSTLAPAVAPVALPASAPATPEPDSYLVADALVTAPAAPAVTAPAVDAPLVSAPVLTVPVDLTPVVAAADVVAAPVVAAPAVAPPVVAAPPAASPPVAAPVVAAPAVAAPVVATPGAAPPVAAPAVAAPTVNVVDLPVLAPALVAASAPFDAQSFEVPTLAPAPRPVVSQLAASATMLAEPAIAVAPPVIAPDVIAPQVVVTASPVTQHAPFVPQSSSFGAAPPTAFVPSYADAPAAAPGRFGAVSSFSPAGFAAEHGVAHPQEFHPDRHWGRRIAVLVVVLAILAGGTAFGLPRYLDSKAAAAAAEAPDILTHSAPASLGGQKRASNSTMSSQATAAFTADGSEWAWAGQYGARNGGTVYVGFDLPTADRAQAYRALTDHGAATEFVGKFAAGVTAGAGGSIVVGTATKYASPVGGSTWCMPITAAGNGGGLCLWTNGKEGLATMILPGVQESAAKATIAALGQLAKATTKASASAAP